MTSSAAAATLPPFLLPGDAVDLAYDLAAEAMKPDESVKPYQVDAYNNAQLDAFEELAVAAINASDMPDAMKQEALAVVGRIIDSYRVPNVDPSIEAEVAELHGADIQQAVDDFWELMMEPLREDPDKTEPEGGSEEGGEGGGAGVSAGGGNWLVRLAQRMADIQIHYAQQLEAASERMAAATEGELVHNPEDKDGPDQAAVDEHNKTKRAEFIRAQAEFTAYSRLFGMASESTSTAIKTIGEGLTSIARKQ